MALYYFCQSIPEAVTRSKGVSVLHHGAAACHNLFKRAGVVTVQTLALRKNSFWFPKLL